MRAASSTLNPLIVNCSSHPWHVSFSSLNLPHCSMTWTADASSGWVGGAVLGAGGGSMAPPAWGGGLGTILRRLAGGRPGGAPVFSMTAPLRFADFGLVDMVAGRPVRHAGVWVFWPWPNGQPAKGADVWGSGPGARRGQHRRLASKADTAASCSRGRGAVTTAGRQARGRRPRDGTGAPKAAGCARVRTGGARQNYNTPTRHIPSPSCITFPARGRRAGASIDGRASSFTFEEARMFSGFCVRCV